MNLANSGQAFPYIYMSGNNIHLIGMLRELNEITDIKYPGHSKAAIYSIFCTTSLSQVAFLWKKGLMVK